MSASEGRSSVDAKILEKEEAAHERRQWIRLTSFCNNRCTFCLDSLALNGSYLPRNHICSQIIDGRRQGATRLVLSGGEPTIHPHFVEFVRLGSQLGYRKVQTVTNGRLFSYRGFLTKCADAGLGEITFSIHGHEAKVHDALVGVPGAFDEAVRGLQNALADGRIVVNVDVCLNRGNIGGLPRLLDRFLELGVREFDLLHIIPFGRAYEEGRRSLFYDIEEAMPSIRYALELSQRPDVHIWFNRFPPPYLEGHESLIQDPHKLHDEVRGREEELDLWIDRGQPLSCREPERCSRCYLEPYCAELETFLDRLPDGPFDAIRVEEPTGLPRRLPEADACFWVRAPDVESARRLVDRLPPGELILELEDYSGIDAAGSGAFGGRRLRRLHVARPEDLELALSLPGGAEVVAWLIEPLAAHLLQLATWPERLCVAARNHERLSEARARDADLRDFFARCPHDVTVENVPACISGRPPRPRLRVLDASALDADGRPSMAGFTDHYLRDGFYTRSHRCRDCIHFEGCEGAHINYVRAHGYRQLQPTRANRSG